MGLIGLRRMVCSKEAVLMLVKWTGTPGVRVDPSSLTQECLTAIGSKKTAADVNAARISCEVRAGRIILRNFASSWGRFELGEKDGSFGEFATSPPNNASIEIWWQAVCYSKKQRQRAVGFLDGAGGVECNSLKEHI